jgi:hypothetical protein
MNKLKVSLKNCYGINCLEEEFDFLNNNSFAIYAPNGVMKTSFAKTFQAISIGKQPEEQLFKNVPFCEILSDGIAIDKNEIIVIKSIESKINSENSVTTLLVDDTSKADYDAIFTNILKKKEALLNKLQKFSGEKKVDVESKILIDFKETDFFVYLSKIDFDNLNVEFSDIKYKEIFEPDVISFIKNPDVKKNITEYTKKYNDLLDNSKYFKKGLFNPSKADNVLKSLSKENFFKANHKIKLSGDEDEILDETTLSKKLEEERKEILENKELAKLESEIKKVSIVRFREILENSDNIIPELEDLNAFKKKLWYSYFSEEKDLIKDLIETYLQGKERLEEIENLAESQRTSWEEIIGKFKSRFHVPFNVSIKNKSSVMLGKSAPNISFSFTNPDTEEQTEMKKDEIEGIDFLSQGEKRAMYLLNVMFNIEARKKENKKTLFIIDDIADSFDYKNKYAIIQYLKDLSNEPLFYQIILTHNFDFFRTIQSRIFGEKYQRDYSLIATVFSNKISLQSAGHKDFTNPFGNWKKELNTPLILVATISFVRNLIEFREGNKSDNYSTLTSLLHIKDNTNDITVSDIKSIYNETLKDINLDSYSGDKKVIELINDSAESISTLVDDEKLNLENKIVLSIGIRLKSEKYMFSKLTITDPIKGNQTAKLFELYKKQYENDISEIDNLKLFDEVNLMTPENIHVNSFMYEPILDLSEHHLKKLYKKVKALEGETVEL